MTKSDELKMKYPPGKIISVHMRYSDEEEVDIATRIEKPCVNGVFVDGGFMVRYDRLSEPTDDQIREVEQEELRIKQMIQSGHNLMNNLHEPEFI